ncbi:Uncharacterised protein [Mycobacteroides abscessus subsp. abscessus]|nr:Uncharacterised protein [Mycobacteroides abscessus subsp. abscessus]
MKAVQCIRHDLCGNRGAQTPMRSRTKAKMGLSSSEIESCSRRFGSYLWIAIRGGQTEEDLFTRFDRHTTQLDLACSGACETDYCM